MEYIGLIVGTVVSGFIVYMFIKAYRLKNMAAVENSAKLHELTDKNFEHQVKSGITLVDFWAPWCMPCKAMGPVLNDLAESVSVPHKVAKLNVDDHQGTAAKLNIRSIPTLVLFKNGKEVDRFVGMKSKDFLMKQMAKYA